uniref:Uncharacterized protein At2g25270 n=1 Tax=Arabidopsis thaliana TaxID=3702 RepID=Q9SIR6_ARATH|nr:hypothetical protein [Arabidopsis thaliana]
MSLLLLFCCFFTSLSISHSHGASTIHISPTQPPAASSEKTGSVMKFIVAEAPLLGPAGFNNPQVIEVASVALAAQRTYRKDPLNGFEKYTGGWNISNQHYWASVSYTAVPLFVLAAVWFLGFGICLLVICMCHICHRTNSVGYSKVAYVVSLIFLLIFTVIAIFFDFRDAGHRLHPCDLGMDSGDCATADTCVAMSEWVERPSSNTALDEILPCTDNATAQETLMRSREVTGQLVELINTVITNVSNINFSPVFVPMYYNQSGPLLPLLCNPFNHDLTDRSCSPGDLDLNNATETFRDITNDHCPGLQRYGYWVYVGLAILATAVMLSLMFWIIYSRERRHRKEALPEFSESKEIVRVNF